MKIINIGILLLTMFLLSCKGDNKDRVVVRGVTAESFQKLEQKLESKKLKSNPLGALPWKFLPVDSSFVMTNPIKYERTQFSSIPMNARMYSDSLGNAIYIYEWDMIRPQMTESEKDAIKKDFENQHHDYVSKYNEMIDLLTEELGAPVYADKGFEANNLEVYESWSSKNRWENKTQVVELKIFLLPTEMYRVTLKNFVWAK